MITPRIAYPYQWHLLRESWFLRHYPAALKNLMATPYSRKASRHPCHKPDYSARRSQSRSEPCHHHTVLSILFTTVVPSDPPYDSSRLVKTWCPTLKRYATGVVSWPSATLKIASCISPVWGSAKVKPCKRIWCQNIAGKRLVGLRTVLCANQWLSKPKTQTGAGTPLQMQNQKQPSQICQKWMIAVTNLSSWHNQNLGA